MMENKFKAKCWEEYSELGVQIRCGEDAEIFIVLLESKIYQTP